MHIDIALDVNLNMKDNYNKMVVTILIGIVIVCVGWVLMKMRDEKPNDISEIHSIVDNYKLEYKSNRGFGNDRFDIIFSKRK